MGSAQIRVLGSRIVQDIEPCFLVFLGMSGGGVRCHGEDSVRSPSGLGHQLKA